MANKLYSYVIKCSFCTHKIILPKIKKNLSFKKSHFSSDFTLFMRLRSGIILFRKKYFCMSLIYSRLKNRKYLHFLEYTINYSVQKMCYLNLIRAILNLSTKLKINKK